MFNISTLLKPFLVVNYAALGMATTLMLGSIDLIARASAQTAISSDIICGPWEDANIEDCLDATPIVNANTTLQHLIDIGSRKTSIFHRFEYGYYYNGKFYNFGENRTLTGSNWHGEIGGFSETGGWITSSSYQDKKYLAQRWLSPYTQGKIQLTGSFSPISSRVIDISDTSLFKLLFLVDGIEKSEIIFSGQSSLSYDLLLDLKLGSKVDIVLEPINLHSMDFTLDSSIAFMPGLVLRERNFSDFNENSIGLLHRKLIESYAYTFDVVADRFIDKAVELAPVSGVQTQNTFSTFSRAKSLYDKGSHSWSLKTLPLKSNLFQFMLSKAQPEINSAFINTHSVRPPCEAQKRHLEAFSNAGFIEFLAEGYVDLNGGEGFIPKVMECHTDIIHTATYDSRSSTSRLAASSVQPRSAVINAPAFLTPNLIAHFAEQETSMVTENWLKATIEAEEFILTDPSGKVISYSKSNGINNRKMFGRTLLDPANAYFANWASIEANLNDGDACNTASKSVDTQPQDGYGRALFDVFIPKREAGKYTLEILSSSFNPQVLIGDMDNTLVISPTINCEDTSNSLIDVYPNDYVNPIEDFDIIIHYPESDQTILIGESGFNNSGNDPQLEDGEHQDTESEPANDSNSVDDGNNQDINSSDFSNGNGSNLDYGNNPGLGDIENGFINLPNSINNGKSVPEPRFLMGLLLTSAIGFLFRQ